jgi:basic membrane protein A and related proteins
MNRKVVISLLLVLSMLLLTACPQQAPEPAPAQPTPVEEAPVDPVEPEVITEPTPEVEEVEEPTPEPEATEPTDEPEVTEPGEVTIERVCLVTDIGRVNDGTFNQFAYEGMVAATEEFDLQSDFIETQSEADYDTNIGTCVQEQYDIIVTVGFLIADATLEAAEANPDIMFIGVDQFFEAPPENLVGIQYREDQGGFLAGALACMLTETDVVGGVYGVDIPPVKKFRWGFEHGCQYVNPDAEAFGVFIPSFIDPAAGASAAQQFLGEGADVIFGAGGPTGSGGIRAAAEAGAWVIGVDQDEYLTTFGEGSAPGASQIITSAIKRVDLGVYDQIRGLVEPDSGLWAGGGLYILEAANEGIGYAPFHEAEEVIPAAVQERLEEILEMLAAGDLNTGVDPVSGDPIPDEIPEPVPFED